MNSLIEPENSLAMAEAHSKTGMEQAAVGVSHQASSGWNEPYCSASGAGLGDIFCRSNGFSGPPVEQKKWKGSITKNRNHKDSIRKSKKADTSWKPSFPQARCAYFHRTKEEWRARYVESSKRRMKCFSLKRYRNEHALVLAEIFLSEMNRTRQVPTDEDINEWYSHVLKRGQASKASAKPEEGRGEDGSEKNSTESPSFEQNRFTQSADQTSATVLSANMDVSGDRMKRIEDKTHQPETANSAVDELVLEQHKHAWIAEGSVTHVPEFGPWGESKIERTRTRNAVDEVRVRYNDLQVEERKFRKLRNPKRSFDFGVNELIVSKALVSRERTVHEHSRKKFTYGRHKKHQMPPFGQVLVASGEGYEYGRPASAPVHDGIPAQSYENSEMKHDISTLLNSHSGGPLWNISPNMFDIAASYNTQLDQTSTLPFGVSYSPYGMGFDGHIGSGMLFSGTGGYTALEPPSNSLAPVPQVLEREKYVLEDVSASVGNGNLSTFSGQSGEGYYPPALTQDVFMTSNGYLVTDPRSQVGREVASQKDLQQADEPHEYFPFPPGTSKLFAQPPRIPSPEPEKCENDISCLNWIHKELVGINASTADIGDGLTISGSSDSASPAHPPNGEIGEGPFPSILNRFTQTRELFWSMIHEPELESLSKRSQVWGWRRDFPSFDLRNDPALASGANFQSTTDNIGILPEVNPVQPKQSSPPWDSSHNNATLLSDATAASTANDECFGGEYNYKSCENADKQTSSVAKVEFHSPSFCKYDRLSVSAPVTSFETLFRNPIELPSLVRSSLAVRTDDTSALDSNQHDDEDEKHVLIDEGCNLQADTKTFRANEDLQARKFLLANQMDIPESCISQEVALSELVSRDCFLENDIKLQDAAVSWDGSFLSLQRDAKGSSLLAIKENAVLEEKIENLQSGVEYFPIGAPSPKENIQDSAALWNNREILNLNPPSLGSEGLQLTDSPLGNAALAAQRPPSELPCDGSDPVCGSSGATQGDFATEVSRAANGNERSGNFPCPVLGNQFLNSRNPVCTETSQMSKDAFLNLAFTDSNARLAISPHAECTTMSMGYGDEAKLQDGMQKNHPDSLGKLSPAFSCYHSACSSEPSRATSPLACENSGIPRTYAGLTKSKDSASGSITSATGNIFPYDTSKSCSIDNISVSSAFVDKLKSEVDYSRQSFCDSAKEKADMSKGSDFLDRNSAPHQDLLNGISYYDIAPPDSGFWNLIKEVHPNMTEKQAEIKILRELANPNCPTADIDLQKIQNIVNIEELNGIATNKLSYLRTLDKQFCNIVVEEEKLHEALFLYRLVKELQQKDVPLGYFKGIDSTTPCSDSDKEHKVVMENGHNHEEGSTDIPSSCKNDYFEGASKHLHGTEFESPLDSKRDNEGNACKSLDTRIKEGEMYDEFGEKVGDFSCQQATKGMSSQNKYPNSESSMLFSAFDLSSLKVSAGNRNVDCVNDLEEIVNLESLHFVEEALIERRLNVIGSLKALTYHHLQLLEWCIPGVLGRNLKKILNGDCELLADEQYAGTGMVAAPTASLNSLKLVTMAGPCNDIKAHPILRRINAVDSEIPDVEKIAAIEDSPARSSSVTSTSSSEPFVLPSFSSIVPSAEILVVAPISNSLLNTAPNIDIDVSYDASRVDIGQTVADSTQLEVDAALPQVNIPKDQCETVCEEALLQLPGEELIKESSCDSNGKIPCDSELAAALPVKTLFHSLEKNSSTNILDTAVSGQDIISCEDLSTPSPSLKLPLRGLITKDVVSAGDKFHLVATRNYASKIIMGNIRRQFRNIQSSWCFPNKGSGDILLFRLPPLPNMKFNASLGKFFWVVRFGRGGYRSEKFYTSDHGGLYNSFFKAVKFHNKISSFSRSTGGTRCAARKPRRTCSYRPEPTQLQLRLQDLNVSAPQNIPSNVVTAVAGE